MPKWPLDKKFNPDYLVGRELIQLCIGQFELQFNFHPASNFTVFHKLQLRGSVDEKWEHGQVPENTALSKLLGQRVAEVTIEAADGLCIRFLSGDTIEVFTQSDYESYTLDGVVV